MNNKTDTTEFIDNSKPKSFVSVCTPTFNRRPFWPYLIRCFELQDYPKNLIEWIIVDDGTDKIEDLLYNVPNIKYFYVNERMTLGKKRNYMNSLCSGEIIIYMDDDDYYPPNRISHGVETLLKNPDYLIAGSSLMYIYYNSEKKVYTAGPYGKYHATAATFVFKKELLNITCFNEDNFLAEEKHFTKNYSIPLIQLNPLKTIIVFSHGHNSLNKELLLENQSICLMNETYIDIRYLIKDNILRDFYVNSIHYLLNDYSEGELSNKPELMKKVKDIEVNLKQHKEDCMSKLKNEIELLKIMNQKLILRIKELEKS